MGDPRLTLDLKLKPGTLFLGDGGVDKWLSGVNNYQFGQTTTAAKPQLTPNGLLYGSGDSLFMPTSSAFDLGTKDFTLSMRYYKSGTPDASARLFQMATGDVVSGISWIHTTANQLGVYMSSNGTTFNVAAPMPVITIVNNTWHHLALVRLGAEFTVYLDGVSASTLTSAAALYHNAAYTLIIGGQNSGPSRSVVGYLTDFQIAVGTALWTSNFTPPERGIYGTVMKNMPSITAISAAVVNQFDSGD